MPLENYKKWSIAVIVLSIAAIVVITTINSNQKEDESAVERKEVTSPAGPMLGPEPTRDASAFPDDPIKLAAIGDTFFEKQNFEQAMIVYEKALKLNPSDVDSYNDLALAYLYTGRSEKAIETIKKGTKLDPTYQRIWLTQGFILLSLKQQEEGIQALEKAFKLDPDSTIGKEANRMIGLIKK